MMTESFIEPKKMVLIVFMIGVFLSLRDRSNGVAIFRIYFTGRSLDFARDDIKSLERNLFEYLFPFFVVCRTV